MGSDGIANDQVSPNSESLIVMTKCVKSKLSFHVEPAFALVSSAKSLKLTLSHPNGEKLSWVPDFRFDVNFGCNHFLKRPREK